MKSIISRILLGMALELPAALAQDTNPINWATTPEPVTNWATVVETLHTNASGSGLPGLVDWGTVPTNIFITDFNVHSWGYGPSGTVIDTPWLLKSIASPESWPAEQDPEGNWGAPVGGFQLSLRFPQRVFTNGQPVVAIVVLRNVSGKEAEWEVPYTENFIFSIVGPDEREIPNPQRSPIMSLSPGHIRFVKNMQKRFEIRLDQKFNLQQAGKYTLQAKAEVTPLMGPPPVYQVVTSGKTAIEIVGPHSSLPQTNAPPTPVPEP